MSKKEVESIKVTNENTMAFTFVKVEGDSAPSMPENQPESIKVTQKWSLRNDLNLNRNCKIEKREGLGFKNERKLVCTPTPTGEEAKYKWLEPIWD